MIRGNEKTEIGYKYAKKRLLYLLIILLLGYYVNRLWDLDFIKYISNR